LPHGSASNPAANSFKDISRLFSTMTIAFTPMVLRWPPGNMVYLLFNYHPDILVFIAIFVKPGQVIFSHGTRSCAAGISIPKKWVQ
jgi:hypothetical protein